ncbi:MAG: 30S ribosomal protein S18 [Alphaproteobacteria bacterium]
MANFNQDDNNDSNSGFDANNKQSFFRRRRGCPLSEANSPEIDYKDIKLLSKFISERGRILPARITSVSAKKQRDLKRALKRARALALLPYAQQ